MALVRGAVRHYCLGGCSAMLVLAQSLRQGGWAGRVLLPAPPSLMSLSRVPRGACGGLPRVGFPCFRLLVRHSMRSLRSASSVWLHFWCAL